MDPTTIDDLLRGLTEYLLKIWNTLPENVKNSVRAEWKALLAAIQAVRSSGVGSGAEFRTILEAFQKFIAALQRAGAGIPKHLLNWLQILKQQIAALGGGGAAEGGGAAAAGGATLAAAIILWLLALVLIAKAIYEYRLAKGIPPAPVGGVPCGTGNPVATGLKVSSWSLWGQRAAFSAAQALARTDAQKNYTCTGTCAANTCRGNCAIQDIRYKYRVFWTWCEVTYDVWCECY